MSLSIIISTYNWPQALNLVLQSLSLQIRQYPDTEVIISDDGSSHTTADIVELYRAHIPRLKHVWHEDNGYRKSISNNKAAAVATCKYLTFLDGDCIPQLNYIKHHLMLMESGYLVAGNRNLLSPQWTQQILHKPELGTQMHNWKLRHWIYSKFKQQGNKFLVNVTLPNGKWRHMQSTNWRYPKGCNFAVFRADFLAVNGFEEEFCGWGHEDTDLFVRLMHYGVKIKDGRFALMVLHLWHKTADMSQASQNMQRLNERIKDKNFIVAHNGIDKYLSIPNTHIQESH